MVAHNQGSVFVLGTYPQRGSAPPPPPPGGWAVVKDRQGVKGKMITSLPDHPLGTLHMTEHTFDVPEVSRPEPVFDAAWNSGNDP